LIAGFLTLAGLLLVLTDLWTRVAWLIYHEEVCWLSADEIGVSEPIIAFSKNAEVSPPVVRAFNSSTLVLSLQVVMAVEGDMELVESPLGEKSPEKYLELIREQEAAVILSLPLNFSLPGRGRTIKAAQAGEVLARYTFTPTHVPDNASGSVQLEFEEAMIVIWRSGSRLLRFDAFGGSGGLSIQLPARSPPERPYHGGTGVELLPSQASVRGGPQRWEVMVGMGYNFWGVDWLKGKLVLDLKLKIRIGFVRCVVFGVPAGPAPGMALPEAMRETC